MLYKLFYLAVKYLVKVLISVVKIFDKKRNEARLFDFYYFVDEHTDKTRVVDDIIFDCRYRMPFKRAKWFLTKEPETQQWIRDQFNENDVFYDIGACVGEYSLYAAKKKGVRVIAFEPSALNYSILNSNIYLNYLDDRIKALNIALNDHNIFSNLETSRNRYVPGKSYNHFYQVKKELDSREGPKFKQGSLGFTLDYLIEIFSLPFPNHIKIDVDGNEDRIIKGMQKTLSDRKLRTIACEVDYSIPEHMQILRNIESHGFKRLDLENKATTERANNLFFIRS